MNILLVDDEIYQLESIQRGIRIYGHSVITAKSAEEALEYLSQHPEEVHLVITDYLLTGMNGLNLLKAIRQEFGNLPVIIMTAYGDKNLVVEALRYRCNDYLDKPFRPQQLLQQIERIEEESRGKVIPFPASRSASRREQNLISIEEEKEAAGKEAASAKETAPAANEKPQSEENEETALPDDPLGELGPGWKLAVSMVKIVFPVLLFIFLSVTAIYLWVLPFYGR